MLIIADKSSERKKNMQRIEINIKTSRENEIEHGSFCRENSFLLRRVFEASAEECGVGDCGNIRKVSSSKDMLTLKLPKFA